MKCVLNVLLTGISHQNVHFVAVLDHSVQKFQSNMLNVQYHDNWKKLSAEKEMVM